MMDIVLEDIGVESLLLSAFSVALSSDFAATKLILGKIGIKNAIRKRNLITFFFFDVLDISLIDVWIKINII